MSLTRKIAHNTITQIVGKIISTLLGLVAIGMMTRYLGQEKFGWYITVTAFLQFIGILTDFGMIVVTAQMLSEPFHNKIKLFKNLFSFRFFTAIFFFGLAPLIALLFPYPTEVKIAIGVTAIAFLSITLNQVFVGLYQTKLKMHIQAIGEVIGRIVLVVGIWLLIKNGSSFLPIMGVVAVSSISHTIFLWIKARKEITISFAFDWPVWKNIIKKMWPIAVAIIFNVVYLKGDLILLSVLVPQSDVGIYGAAYRVLDVITQSAMMIMGILLPLMAFAWSRKRKHEFKKYYQQSFDIMMLFAIPMMLGVIILSNKIMQFIAGNEFADSGKILAILSIAVFGVFFGAIFGHTAVAINKQKQTLWIYISNAFIALTAYLIFIPMYGLYGAAWVSVFSELYAGILLFFTIRHYTKEKLRFNTTIKIIFASLVMCLVLKFTSQLHVLFMILIGMMVYSAVLLLVGGISKKTIKEIINTKK
jgi:O-antigen/teichoic acid export membrane protein